MSDPVLQAARDAMSGQEVGISSAKFCRFAMHAHAGRPGLAGGASGPRSRVRGQLFCHYGWLGSRAHMHRKHCLVISIWTAPLLRPHPFLGQALQCSCVCFHDSDLHEQIARVIWRHRMRRWQIQQGQGFIWRQLQQRRELPRPEFLVIHLLSTCL